MNKPEILAAFGEDGWIWTSVGWAHDVQLMDKARKAINAGETREDVIELLSATFNVTEGAQQ